MTRWKFDWTKPGSFEVETLSGERCEYPRIDERFTGSRYRHGYVACKGGPGSDDIFHRGIAHFDHLTREMRIFSAGPRCAVGEPVFVPKSDLAEEGEGYVLMAHVDWEDIERDIAQEDYMRYAAGGFARAASARRAQNGTFLAVNRHHQGSSQP